MLKNGALNGKTNTYKIMSILNIFKLNKIKLTKIREGMSAVDAEAEARRLLEAAAPKLEPTASDSAAAPSLSIMQRLKGASALQVQLQKLQGENVILKDRIARLKSENGGDPTGEISAALSAEKSAHIETKAELEKALAAAKIAPDQVSARAVEMLAEVGFPSGDLPSATSDGSTGADGLRGRDLFMKGFKEENPGAIPGK